MLYEIQYTPEANRDLAKLLKDEPKAFQKAIRFIEELREHPKTGLGHPEPLKGKPEGRWSREISKKTSFGLSNYRVPSNCFDLNSLRAL